MDPFFLWLESTAGSIWLRESPSIFAFPVILALHTIGLSLLAGLTVAFDLRILGIAPRIPVREFDRFVPLMWVGLWLNVTSGVALLTAYPTKALTNPVFFAKLVLIASALLILKTMRRRVHTGGARPKTLKGLAVASLVCWAGAITTGRLLAYTYTRRLADF